MINFDGKEMQEEFERAFSNSRFKIVVDNTASGGIVEYRPPKISDLTLEILWFLVKFAKHVRGRCRNNSAFNNYMNRNFSPAQFREIPKSYTNSAGIEKYYQGLQIKVGENISEGEDNE